MTNKKPSQLSITKVKQFQGSTAFAKRSHWTIDQLRQVNGIDPNKVCNFYLIFSAVDFDRTTRTKCVSNKLLVFFSLSLSGVLSKDSPEFDLTFENAFDQWVAGSAGEKCTFIQVLHHTCQRHSSARKPEFVNCQSKLLGGKKVQLTHCAHRSFITLLLKHSHSLMPDCRHTVL